MDLADRFSSQCADLWDKLSFARTQLVLARRQRDRRRVRLWGRFIVKCRRALRYAARIEAGTAQEPATGPTGPTAIFSGTLEKFREAPTPPAAPEMNRRRTFRERLRRW